MKKYSCKRAKKGKVAYRTPSRFIYQQCKNVFKRRAQELRQTKTV